MSTLLRAIPFIFMLLPSAYAEEAVSIAQPIIKVEEKRNTLMFHSGASSITTDASSATGLDFGVSYSYAFNKKMALVASIRQGLNTSGFGTLYTDIGAGVALSLRGNSLMQEVEEVSINGMRSASSKPYNQGGTVLTAQMKQYLFNGTNSVVPVVGLSMGGYYIFPSSEKINLHVGGSLDYGQNTDITLTGIKVYAGIQFWL